MLKMFSRGYIYLNACVSCIWLFTNVNAVRVNLQQKVDLECNNLTNVYIEFQRGEKNVSGCYSCLTFKSFCGTELELSHCSHMCAEGDDGSGADALRDQEGIGFRDISSVVVSGLWLVVFTSLAVFCWSTCKRVEKRLSQTLEISFASTSGSIRQLDSSLTYSMTDSAVTGSTPQESKQRHSNSPSTVSTIEACHSSFHCQLRMPNHEYRKPKDVSPDTSFDDKHSNSISYISFAEQSSDLLIERHQNSASQELDTVVTDSDSYVSVNGPSRDSSDDTAPNDSSSSYISVNGGDNESDCSSLSSFASIAIGGKHNQGSSAVSSPNGSFHCSETSRKEFTGQHMDFDLVSLHLDETSRKEIAINYRYCCSSPSELSVSGGSFASRNLSPASSTHTLVSDPNDI